MIYQHILNITTQGKQAIDITTKINQIIAKSEAKQGLCHLFLQHTSTALMIVPNADTDVLLDIESYLEKSIPEDANYRHHNYKGDMAGHLRTLLIGMEKTIPVTANKLNLGSLQGVFVYEFSQTSKQREVIITIYK